MIKKLLSSVKRYNKATAAAVAQALVQLAAAFLDFEPELEQSIGVVLTALLVLLVPNKAIPPAQTTPMAKTANMPFTAHLPMPAMIMALVLGLGVAGCAGLVPGDRVADRFVGPDCGPESRALRARMLTDGLARVFPGIVLDRVEVGVSMMEAAVAGSDDLDLPAAIFQDALGQAMMPILIDAGLTGNSIWLSLSRLPPVAGELVFIRRQLAVFCAGQGV